MVPRPSTTRVARLAGTSGRNSPAAVKGADVEDPNQFNGFNRESATRAQPVTAIVAHSIKGRDTRILVAFRQIIGSCVTDDRSVEKHPLDDAPIPT
jgi:hypothetical protein